MGGLSTNEKRRECGWEKERRRGSDPVPRMCLVFESTRPNLGESRGGVSSLSWCMVSSDAVGGDGCSWI